MYKGKTTEKVLDNVTRSKICLYHVTLVFHKCLSISMGNWLVDFLQIKIYTNAQDSQINDGKC